MEIVMKTDKKLSEEVWEAKVEPSEVGLFGKPFAESGPVSVIQVTGAVTSDDTTLQFDPRHAQVLNRGRSDRAIVIANGLRGGRERAADVSSAGDQRFLADTAVDPKVHRIASRLLAGVRSMSPGSLMYTPSRYVDTPDNFWTVKPQTKRAHSLAITVRGKPELFQPSTLRIVDDRPGYSRFTVDSDSQIDDAIAAIRRARRK
jgi:hypothetical protein